MPVFSRISLNKVSCSKSPRSSWGPWRCVLGSTSPVCSKSFKYRLTERSETHNSWEIVDAWRHQIFCAMLSHTILHLKSTEYGRGIATALYLLSFRYENLNLPGVMRMRRTRLTGMRHWIMDNQPKNCCSPGKLVF